jgi:hypothetical protein
MFSEDQYLNALFASLRVQPLKFDKRFFKSYDTIPEYYNFLRYPAGLKFNRQCKHTLVLFNSIKIRIIKIYRFTV